MFIANSNGTSSHSFGLSVTFCLSLAVFLKLRPVSHIAVCLIRIRCMLFCRGFSSTRIEFDDSPNSDSSPRRWALVLLLRKNFIRSLMRVWEVMRVCIIGPGMSNKITRYLWKYKFFRKWFFVELCSDFSNNYLGMKWRRLSYLSVPEKNYVCLFRAQHNLWMLQEICFMSLFCNSAKKYTKNVVAASRNFLFCHFFATAQKSNQKTPPLLKKLLKINSLR